MRSWSACPGTPAILFPVSTKVGALRTLHPDVSFSGGLSDGTRLVVLDPMGDLPCALSEVPERYPRAVAVSSNRVEVCSPASGSKHADGPGP